MKRSIVNRNQVLILMVLCTLFVSQLSVGQSLEDALGFSETVNDVPEAPISMFIGIAALIGSYLGFRKLKA